MLDKVQQLVTSDGVGKQSADDDEASTAFYHLPVNSDHAAQSVTSPDDG